MEDRDLRPRVPFCVSTTQPGTNRTPPRPVAPVRRGRGRPEEYGMTEKTSENGRRQRQTLSAEIERLHDILDGLNEALQGIVTTAVKEAVGQVVREAVQAAVREV